MKIAPSLLAANFIDLQSDVEMINCSEASYLHLDIMDGVFVPNISFGFPVMEAVGKISEKPLDVHLMIVEPDKWVDRIKNIGAEIMNVHYEACTHLHSTVQRIHRAGMKAGVTLCPATPVNFLSDIIRELDLVLLMSVNPGFGGQPFIPHTVQKVKQLRELIESTGSKAMIEVDGGINLTTGKEIADAGADILVAGNAIFSAPDPIGYISELSDLRRKT